MSENTNKVMIITGTSNGIGAHLAEHYAQRGFTVIGCSRSQVKAMSENYHHYSLDITDEKRVMAFFAEVRQKFGGIDVLINNAGIFLMSHFLMTSQQKVKDVININFLSTFLFCREATKLMRRSTTARIINFTSVAVPLNLDGETAYAASKGAVESLTKILARELAPYKITVNAVGPAPTETAMLKDMPKDHIEKLLAKQAIPRLCEMHDISNVTDFFINSTSDFITGQILYLGGV